MIPSVILGKPAKPYPVSVNSALSRVVSKIEGVAELHFPQIFIAGQMQTAEQTLIVVLGQGRDEQTVMRDVVEAVKQALPDGPDINMMAMTGKDRLLTTVRGTDCRLLQSSTELP